ncbi:MAG: hypothetical protein DI628_06295 [Blastochloris viridis]|uniref:Uncharacterized protein n=1 Tax=Blastochloris viridis TaxID=1079 RepID=A0A6N4RBR8_BLAVI|nr:MAG: hypothetical protein DI628_06295 [Blastochloris viridis]
MALPLNPILVKPYLQAAVQKQLQPNAAFGITEYTPLELIELNFRLKTKVEEDSADMKLLVTFPDTSSGHFPILEDNILGDFIRA